MAVEDVSRGVPLLTASKNYGVPRTTLRRYMNDGASKFKRMGPSAALTKNEEETLVLWITSVAKAGFPVTKDDLLDSVQKLLKDLGRKNDFADGRPGRSWFKCFLKRNPQISTRVVQNLTVTRASVTNHNLQNWFSEVFTYLKEVNFDYVLLEPNRIFNADETAFFLNPKGSRVLAPKGTKTVYQQVNSNEKECLTVLICASADGHLAPPLVVFKYERIPQEIVSSVPREWGIGKSDRGWMTGALFYEYLTNVFYPWLIKNEIPRPVILFVDGHTSHLTLHTSSFCNENGIVLVALFPNATHLIHPMDVAVFRSLKENWKNKVHDWRLKNTENPILKKKDFSGLLKEVLDEKVSPSIIRNGFRKCGIFPWDPTAPLQNVSPPNSTSTPVRHKCKSSECVTALKVLESYIGHEKVHLFKQTLTWTGPVEDKQLFEIWHKMTQDILNEVSPLTEESLSQDVMSLDMLDCEVIPSHLEESSANAENNNGNCELAENQSAIVQSEIPSPFKRSLFWPECKKKGTSQKKKREHIPSVVTSDKWRQHIQLKENRKLELQKQKEERKLNRQMKKEEKETTKQRKAKEKEQKKKIVSKKNANKKKRVKISTSEDEDSWNPSGNSSDDYSIFGDEDSLFDNSLTAIVTSQTPEMCDSELNLNTNLSALVEDESQNRCTKSGDEQDLLSNPSESEFLDTIQSSNNFIIDKDESIEAEVQCGGSMTGSKELSNLGGEQFQELHGRGIDHLSEKNITEGDFILISRIEKKKVRKSVCQIETIDNDGTLSVVLLNPCNRLKNVFSKIGCMKNIKKSEIVLKLTKPLVFGTLQNKRYQFPGSLDVGNN